MITLAEISLKIFKNIAGLESLESQKSVMYKNDRWFLKLSAKLSATWFFFTELERHLNFFVVRERNHKQFLWEP